jgi:uncharacterized membrane protein YbhN (UPF0104 family)
VPDPADLRRRLADLEVWIRGRVPAAGWQRHLLIGGVLVALGVAAAIAVQNLPEGTTLRVAPVLALAAATTATLVLNALEHAATARLAGGRERFFAALRVSVYGNIANLLPLPGSVFVRVQALRNRGHRGTVALGATAAVGVCWIAVSFGLAGPLLVTVRPMLGSALLLGAVAGGVLCVAWGRRLPAERPGPLWVEVVLIEAAKVAVQAFRLHLALVAVGASPTLGQSFALGISVSLSSATAFLPAGLGVREVMGSALSAMVGIPAAIGLLATLVDRAVGLAMALPLSAVVLLLPQRADAAPPVSVDVT